MFKYKLQNLSGFPDCISLSESGKCNRLAVSICQGEKCHFKRTRKEDIDSIRRTYQRLSSLNSSTQSHIANKYYHGSFPWHKKQKEVDQ